MSSLGPHPPNVGPPLLPPPHQAPPYLPPPLNAHPPLPMPPSQEMQSIMDKTAQKVVSSQNPLEFEQMIRNKQTSNPQFPFLYRGHPYNHYYEFRKDTLRQQQQLQQNKAPNTVNNQNINITEFHTILSSLNGSNMSINNACKWIIDHQYNAKAVCDALKAFFVQNLANSPDFDKKLFILFMINDVLHQALKMRESVNTMDTLSICLSNILFFILPNCYQNYSIEQQQKVMFLLNLWTERSIFSNDLVQRMRDVMIGGANRQSPMMNAPPLQQPPSSFPWSPAMAMPPHPQFGGNQQRMQKVVTSPQNTLNVSIGDVVKMALEMRRNGGGGTYVALPLDKVRKGLDVKEDRNRKSNLKRAISEYYKDLALIDPSRFKTSHKSSSRRSSKSSRRRRRRSNRDSRSASRSYSRSRSRSRSLSSSR